MNVAIILAAGRGSRFGDTTPKQFQKLNGKQVFLHTVERFQNHPQIDHVIVVFHPDYEDVVETLDVDWKVAGGETRHASTYNGFMFCPEGTEKILVHDAVRPFVSEETITECLEKLDEFEVVDVCCRSDDTIAVVEGSEVKEIPPRSRMWRGQTPQGFQMVVLRKILGMYPEPPPDREFTDTVGIALHIGYRVGLVESSPENMKITHPYDLFLAERITQYRTADVREPDVDGRRICVLGGSGGIGSEVVKLLEESGAVVYAPSRATLDFSDSGWFQQFAAKDEQWDCVVYCAGSMCTGRELGDWHKMSLLHVEVPAKLMGLPHAFMRHGGNLVFVGSSAAIRGRARFPMYSASKAALVNLVEGMAPWLAEEGVRVNCVNPGLTNTRMVDQIGGGSGDPLDPAYVARAIISYCMTLETGQIVHVR